MTEKRNGISPEQFRAEASRRLVDTFGVMVLLGVRSRQTIWRRVEAGQMPAPVLVIADTVALWDKDELAPLVSERVA